MTNNPYILIVEDDPSIINFLSVSLKEGGYRFDSVKTGEGGLSLFHANNPDLVLLDLGLPDLDGTEVLRGIRAKSATPVIVISARGQEVEKVQALDLGADDYVTKPFYAGELMARVRVALRRREGEKAIGPVAAFNGLSIDFERRIVSLDGVEIHLTPTEYRLLALLAENPGKVLTHGYISQKVWGHAFQEDYQSLRVCMANLRRKIDRKAGTPEFIRTEVGVGYRFAGE